MSGECPTRWKRSSISAVCAAGVTRPIGAALSSGWSYMDHFAASDRDGELGAGPVGGGGVEFVDRTGDHP